jgi:CrcB protein
MKLLFLIGTGGFIGSIARYLTQQGISRVLPVIFPYGTLLVNVSGSFLIGILYALTDRGNLVSPEWRFFLATGFCGGFTTFSTFSYETYGLLREGEYLFVFLYIVLSVTVSLLATVMGVTLIRSI